VAPVNLEMVERKVISIFKARNYVYGKGEAEKISNLKFEKALKNGNLSGFPNVIFFEKKKLMRLN